MKVNTKPVDYRKDVEARLAGGFGVAAAIQTPEALLRRAVLSTLLGENIFYEDGVSVQDNIKKLIPLVAPEVVYNIAIEAKTKQKLRHVPLLIAREMLRYDSHKYLVGELLPQIMLRVDDIPEFYAMYWQEGKCPIASQARKGTNVAFCNERFSEYNFAKYANRPGIVKLKDVMFMTRPKPPKGKEELFQQIANDSLPTPDTWEVALSTGKDKQATWTRLIKERKLGALAFLRNLSNMRDAGVSREIIKEGFKTINPSWLLPINFIAAAKKAPEWERELEAMMLTLLGTLPKLPKHSIFVVDVSGSMCSRISAKSTLNRLEAAATMAMLAAEQCESISIWATAGNDGTHVHQTELLKPRRGFAMVEDIVESSKHLGGGGIFTRQCLDYIRDREETPERIMVFSDSQDCDHPDKRIPSPFGNKNYIIDVSSHSRGINYDGIWTAEISGWSEHFLTYIAGYEGLEIPSLEQEEFGN